MIKKATVFWLTISLNAVAFLYAQESPSNTIEEEESAEVFLEEYTDKFQDLFFEALKQKSIQNYDRAINLFLECKLLQKQDATINHELAKTYLADKNAIEAQKSALEAVAAEPENYWFLNTLVTVLEELNNPIERIKEQIPFTNQKLQQNLALIYYKQEKYADSKKILNGITNKSFKNQLLSKIEDTTKANKRSSIIEEDIVSEKVVSENPAEVLKIEFETLIASKEFKKLQIKAADAVERYPLQPYFYYAYGVALNNTGNANKAIEVLQSGLDFLFEPTLLTTSIYEELADAYTKLGNASKANEYLSKLKSGL
ncbi:hypothetical protein GCM10011414_05750 [Croceivirga lutea]|uniref:tetratricopeptide repeat protein n=1 Tax=Croceivirga lutea TaxID=1775167 RepID=UPI001639E90D|nr:hypothetical protein [Croceivirga lutea]GGG39256.1 hypothetical protein GCM10011414_05750 [Croceivirga lutea]